VKRTALLLTGTVAVLGVTAPVSTAAPKKKPITKTYTATAPLPDPTNFVGAGGAEAYSVCNQVVPQSFHNEPFTAPAAGTLKIELTQYQGDWDLLLMNDKDEEIAFSGLTDVQGAPEVVQVKFKKKTAVQIIACNWAGGPTGTVKYTFTYK
jgi:hypothetical protein